MHRSGVSPYDAQAAVDEIRFWYHAIDVAPGVTTPGLFDARPVVPRLPWPDVAGKRCLDVGTYDGFFAFEMERRGAAEVVAVDVPDKREYDWPLGAGPDTAGGVLPLENGQGFAVAAKLLGSAAQWKPVSIYDLSPDTVGEFDVVVCSSLLVHLRDPVRALQAVASVCRGSFLSCEVVDLWLTLLGRRLPLARFDGRGSDCQWWTPNSVAHYRMLQAAGFVVDEAARPVTIPFMHHQPKPAGLRSRVEDRVQRAITGMPQQGVLQRPLLARRT